MAKQKIHPIWWLVGFSLFIGVTNHVLEDTAQSSQPTNPADYQAEVSKAIAEITDMDAHGNMSYQPNYETAILTLDTHCPEKLSDVLKLSFNEIEARGEDGIQFALLNELEDTAYMIEQSGQPPTNCTELIAQSSYE